MKEIKKKLELLTNKNLEKLCSKFNCQIGTKEEMILQLLNPVYNQFYTKSFHDKLLHKKMKHYDTLIVGAGITGLYLSSKIPNSLVLERRTKVGGKVRTTYDNKGKALFDDGPWRIHQSHKRVLKLLKSLHISVQKNASSSYNMSSDSTSCKSGLSTFGSNIINNSIVDARNKNIATGYDGIHMAECTSNVYHGQRRHKKGNYFYVKKGVREIINKLYEIVKNRVCTGCMVTDIKRNNENNSYTVYYSTLDGSTKKLTVSNIILCAPPEQLRLPSIYQWLEFQASAIQSLPLMHIWAKLSSKKQPKGKKIIPNSALSQIIAGDLSEYFQISYSAGETAIFLKDLHLNDPKGFRKFLENEFAKYSDIPNGKLVDIQPRYWNDAVHMWRPILSDSKKTIYDLMQLSIEPHPVELPNMYWAGECFSTNQGWMEGSLETADLVLKRIKNPIKVIPRNPKNTEIIINGRIVDVKTFKNKHPGSKKVIEQYLGKNATNAFTFIPHPAYAKSYVYMLQTGWSKNIKR